MFVGSGHLRIEVGVGKLCVEPGSAVSLTRDDRFEQKKVLFVESSAQPRVALGTPLGWS